jgi:hypothetical protein
VWVPRPGKPRFLLDGVTRVATARVRGGWVATGCANGRWSLRLGGRDAPGRSCGRAVRLLDRSPSVRRGRVPLRLASSRAESTCAGTATITVRRRGRTVRAGKARFSLVPGARRRIAVRLSRGARKGARLVLSGSDVDDAPFRRRVALRLR